MKIPSGFRMYLTNERGVVVDIFLLSGRDIRQTDKEWFLAGVENAVLTETGMKIAEVEDISGSRMELYEALKKARERK